VVPGVAAPPPDPGQLALFGAPAADPALEELRGLDLDRMTPLDALNRLAELKKKAGK
jgi:DNA mismatch repair protein MutS